jgi:hypothetical protein
MESGFMEWPEVKKLYRWMRKIEIGIALFIIHGKIIIDFARYDAAGAVEKVQYSGWFWIMAFLNDMQVSLSTFFYFGGGVRNARTHEGRYHKDGQGRKCGIHKAPVHRHFRDAEKCCDHIRTTGESP